MKHSWLIGCIAAASIVFTFPMNSAKAMMEADEVVVEQDEEVQGCMGDEEIDRPEGTQEKEQAVQAGDMKVAREVLDLVNQERTKRGLEPLNLDSNLQMAASLRVHEVDVKFSYERPDGSDCFTVLSELNIPYHACGENIAKGQQDAAAVMDTWMHSEGHRANILSDKYYKIGIGYYPDSKCWVQLFTD